MCAGRSVMQVEDDYAQDDGERDEDHGEHDIVDDDRNAQGGFWDLVSQQKHEDGQSDEDGNGESHLFSCKQQGQYGEQLMSPCLSFKMTRSKCMMLTRENMQVIINAGQSLLLCGLKEVKKFDLALCQTFWLISCSENMGHMLK